MSTSDFSTDSHVVGPDHIAWNPRLLLSFHVAIADVGEAQRAVAVLAQNFGHGSAHRSKANQRHAAGGACSCREAAFAADFASALRQTNHSPSKKECPIIRATPTSRKLQTAAGGCAGRIGIKVDNMVPACCDVSSRREHRGHDLSQAPLVTEVWAAAWAERDGPQTRPVAGGE